MATIETTRRAMYDLVWSKPMSQVAVDFGISDVALKKICVRHRVPTPARGYWAKKQAGHVVRQIRFVETADPEHELIRIYGNTQSRLPEPVQQILKQERAERTARKAVSIPAASHTQTTDVHRVVSATVKALRTGKPDKDGAISARGAGMCGVSVGAASVERAIRILDSLASTLEARGLLLVPTGNAMSITTEGQTVKFSITERIQREKHVPTAEELAAEDRRKKRRQITWESPYGRTYPEWDFIRTGQLALEIENGYLTGFRRSWNDGKRQRLENAIEDIVVGLVSYGAGLKLKAEEHARWHRNWERRSRVNRRAEERKEREKKRGAVLDELLAISVEAAKLQAWLKEAQRWPQPVQPDEFSRFVEWARARLGRLEHAVDPSRIAEALRERNLFPESDPLVDPPEDLVEE